MKRPKRFTTFAAIAAVVALAAGVATVAAAKSTTRAAANGTCKTLHLFTWEGDGDKSIIGPFEKQYHVTVVPTYYPTEDAEVAKLAAGGKNLEDVVIASSDNRQELIDAGVIKPLDLSKLRHYGEVMSFLKPAYKVDGKVWAVPQDWGINPYIYNSANIKKAPTSWNVLWSSQLKGRVSLWGDYSLLYVGATVLGYDKHPSQLWNLSDAQLAAIKTKMLALKPQVRKMWSNAGDLIQLFANNEVDGALGWNYVYSALAAKKFPVKQVVFKDMGAQGWIDASSISTGISAACEPVAYEWISYMTSAKAQAALAKVTGYAVANLGARRYLTKAQIKATFMDNPQKYAAASIIRIDPVNRPKYIKVEEEIQAGLG
jgi:spermidine/putrescine-binding protein